MNRRSAIKDDLFAADERREKIGRLGDLLAEVETHVDFGALAAEVGRIAATASVHDSRHFEAALDPSNASRDLYADRGYPSQAREAGLKQSGYRNHIQCKGTRAIRFPNASAGATAGLPRPVCGSSTVRWSRWAAS